MKILIVEDNARVRRMIRNLVTGVANEIVECANGTDAFESYQTHRPDWVLLDIGLKDVDGIEVTDRIKSVFPEARIVILTSHNDPHLRRLAQRAGASAYVLKETLFELRGLVSASSSPKPCGQSCLQTTSTGPDLTKDQR